MTHLPCTSGKTTGAIRLLMGLAENPQVISTASAAAANHLLGCVSLGVHTAACECLTLYIWISAVTKTRKKVKMEKKEKEKQNENEKGEQEKEK
jgi:flagellar biosynthesis component FlhA